MLRVPRLTLLCLGAQDDDEDFVDLSEDTGTWSEQSQMNKLLRFRSRALESHFISKYYYEKYLSSVRQAIVFGTIVWVLFAATDVLKNRQGQRKNFALTMIVRAISCAIDIVCLVLSYSKPVFEKAMSVIVSVGILAFGTSQIVFGLIEGDTLDPT